MLFANQRKHSISLPSNDDNGKRATLGFLVRYLCNNVMKDQRKEMFLIDCNVYGTAISAQAGQSLM